MSENDNQNGVLTSEFIKAHLKKESELEDKIYLLNKEIEILKDNNSETKYFNILCNMLKYGKINRDHVNSYTDYTLSIDEYPISSDEYLIVEELIKIITKEDYNISSPDIGVNKSYSSTYGLGGTPRLHNWVI